MIWNLHQGNNKVIAANKEAILVMPNRYGSDSGIRTRTMRNLVPWWNATSISTPDNKLAVDRLLLLMLPMMHQWIIIERLDVE